MKTTFPLLIIFFSCMVFGHAMASTGDELNLCGVVQQIDRTKGTVKIDVTSASCPGTQIFKLPAQTGTSLEVGDKRCFRIDNTRCSDVTMYTIMKVEGE